MYLGSFLFNMKDFTPKFLLNLSKSIHFIGNLSMKQEESILGGKA